MTIRVLLADDQEMVRDGFRMILSAEPDIEVVGDAGNGEDAVRQVLRRQPHVVLMDIRMPVLDGLAATARISAAGSPTKVVILTTFDDDAYVYEALAAGASAFLLKDAPAARLVDAIRLVAAGQAMLAPTVTRRLIQQFARRRPAPHENQLVSRLSARERDVLRLMAEGMSNGEIATALFVSEATVKTHVSRILTKLEARDRVQAVITAYRSAFMDPT